MIDANAERLRAWRAKGFSSDAEFDAFNAEVDAFNAEVERHNWRVAVETIVVGTPLAGIALYALWLLASS